MNTPMRSTFGGNSRMISCACWTDTRRALAAKMKPKASAPACTEASASAIEVVPQILIHVRIKLSRSVARKTTELCHAMEQRWMYKEDKGRRLARAAGVSGRDRQRA